jgi:putative CocE/NonD family hydrolase
VTTFSPTPTVASRVQQFTGRVLGKLLRLPPHTSAYRVQREIRIPMRDGVDLIADHYIPLTNDPMGTLLVRGPYGRGGPFATLYAAVYAARGFHVILQSVRGTFGSAGEFTPAASEIADGADTAAWLREQSWFTGSFGTIGLSYLGYTQWALLQDPPPELTAAVITVAPHDFAEATWGTGAFTLDDFLGWSDLVARQEDPRGLQTFTRRFRARKLLTEAEGTLPLTRAGRTLLGAGAPWWESWAEAPAPGDAFWETRRATRALDHAQLPVLLIGGWQDVFLDQTLTQYEHLRRRGVPTALTVGPWTHFHLSNRAVPIVLRETLDWLGTHLAGDGAVARSPVRIHLGNHGWLDLPDWPPQMPQRSWFLQPGGRLGDQAPGPTVPAATFRYDPTEPTPTLGGRVLALASGVRNDTRLAERADVVAFTGEPLPADLYVVGRPVVELSHTCDNAHHDIFVRVSEVDRKGRSRNVTDGFRRLTRTESDTVDGATVRIELDATAHRFTAGSRLRLLIAGGSHPRFARNLGTGESPGAGTRTMAATHTVHLGDGGYSRLILPAGDRPPSAD